MRKAIPFLLILLTACSTPAAEVTFEELQIKENPQVKEALPESLSIDMPFFTQAPHANWDYPWQEACEEASVLLVANLYLNMNLNTDTFNDELLRLVDWEMQHFGYYEHTTTEETLEMLQLNYNLDAQIIENPTLEDIKVALNKGHLLIAPFDGKTLENPNFRNGGPKYHMSVIKGYDGDTLLVHDVGTRNGENFRYSWENIQLSLHDWHDEDMQLGTPLLIEVSPS